MHDYRKEIVISEKFEIVSEINKKVAELNALFEKAASHYVTFNCRFNQDQDFGKGKVAHLSLKSYVEIINL